MKELPINAAGRNVVWVYDHVVAPRFPGAPAIIETTRSHQMPDFAAVPEGSDISVEIYGRAVMLSLRGDYHRVLRRALYFRIVYYRRGSACGIPVVVAQGGATRFRSGS